MRENKKVSIILCFYNEERYLAKAIDSVLEQTYSNFELILVNDGSTDKSDQIVKKYHDSRIVYKSYEGNKRLAYARNRGLELATGDYIGFFDADDIMMPYKIERQVKYLEEHSEIIAVSGGYIYMDAEGNSNNKIIEPEYLSDSQIRAYMLFGNCIAVGAALFRREIIDKHGIMLDEKNKASEDYQLWIDMLPYGKFANIKGAFYKYRVNHGSKADSIVKSDTSAYDTEVKKVLKHAWESQGFSVDGNDIQFIYKYIFQKRRVLMINDFVQGIRTYRKIKCQQSILNHCERELVLKYYKKCWLHNYHIYWFCKKLINSSGEKL